MVWAPYIAAPSGAGQRQAGAWVTPAPIVKPAAGVIRPSEREESGPERTTSHGTIPRTPIRSTGRTESRMPTTVGSTGQKPASRDDRGRG